MCETLQKCAKDQHILTCDLMNAMSHRNAFAFKCGSPTLVEPATVAKLEALFKEEFCVWVGTQDELDDSAAQF